MYCKTWSRQCVGTDGSTLQSDSFDTIRRKLSLMFQLPSVCQRSLEQKHCRWSNHTTLWWEWIQHLDLVLCLIIIHLGLFHSHKTEDHKGWVPRRMQTLNLDTSIVKTPFSRLYRTEELKNDSSEDSASDFLFFFLTFFTALLDKTAKDWQEMGARSQVPQIRFKP